MSSRIMKCPICKGTGIVKVYLRYMPEGEPVKRKCQACGGRGSID